MRNLKVNRIKRAPLELTNGKISAIVVVDDGSALYYVRDGEFCMVRENQETILSPEIFENVLVEPEYLSFERRVWFATHDKLVYYACETEQLIIIPLEKSAYCFAWNPTREILAVVHEDTEVATYSVDLENGCAQRLDFTTTVHNAVPHGVYVGWGSTDTQFRGSEGKLRRKKKTTTVQCTRQPVEDKMPRITWRGNGEMFAVNYWRDDRRTFKVFQQDCKPLYECCYGEDDDGLLQSVIAWRPEGNMIANSVRLDDDDDRYCVIVFEKNGYKRFSVPLVYERYEVKELKWSHRGEVLAVLQADHYLSLYTTSNYKWYLKQHLVLREPLISFGWSTIFDLQVFTQNDFFTYEFQIVYDVCDDCVAIIDGNELHLTRFRNSCLPPPLTQITVRSKRDAAINCVVMSPAGNKLQFAIVDCDWHVAIYSYENDNTIQILCSFKIQSTESTVFQNFHWFKNVLFCVAVPRQAQITLVSLTDDGEIVSEKQQYDLDLKRVRNIQNIYELNGRLYQLENEVVVFIETERNTKHTTILSDKCLLLKSIYSSIENESYVFSLTATNDFYINDRCVSKSVTSFTVLFDRYLLLTTATNNLLYCIRLLRNQLQLLNNDDLSAHFFHRPIEQGARLICGVNDTSLIILQIPRGNLEIISCRPIAIDILEHHLSLNDWREALHFLRTDRLNSNLLIDLNVDRFLKNIDKFVDACKTPAVLNTFIQEIEESNVLETIYLQCYHHQSAASSSSNNNNNNKRTLICNALLSYFQEVDYANYAIPIVTLALHHFDIEMALTYIQDLYHRLPQTETALANAVKTLIIHARTEGDDFLFKKSLQLYDTNFTRHICSFTQLDPKFYLPFLNELDAYTQVQRRYNINVYLKKPELAVQYLIRDASAHADALLQYIERHRQVLPTVYSYYSRESPMFQQISKLYGDWLSERKKYTEAAAVYSRAELWMETFAQYKLANDWLAAITILNTRLLDVVKDRHGIITAIGDDLIRIRKYKEAATIQEQYLNNYEDAIKTLLCGYHFRDAIFLTVKHKRHDIISKLLLLL